MMWSILLGYPFIETSYEFTEIRLSKKITDKVLVASPLNDFIVTEPFICQPSDQCSLTNQQFNRLRDLNNSKGNPSLQELFDMRPCYLLGFRNLWLFVDCFSHILTENVTKNNPALVLHDITISG